MNYHKNDLIDECLGRFYQTFSLTLDTCDYVPKKYNDKILKYIFKCMKKSFRKIDKEDKVYQRNLTKQVTVGDCADTGGTSGTGEET